MKIGSASTGFQTEDAIPLSETLVPIVTIKTYLTEYIGTPYSKCVKHTDQLINLRMLNLHNASGSFNEYTER